MKKLIKTMLTVTIVPVLLFASCKTANEKVEDAKDDVTEAKADLKEAQADELLAEEAAEFEIMKHDADQQIANNKLSIMQLKQKNTKVGSKTNQVYLDRIDSLETANENMNYRITTYEKSHSSWESFKREYNHDMDALGEALRSLGTDNKK